MASGEQSLFRKETMDRISSPEDLTDYLKVTNPGIWVVLVAVIVLLGGIFAWSCVGTLETTSKATVVVSGHSAIVVLKEAGDMAEGMPLRVSTENVRLAAVHADQYGRSVGIAEVSLPDGTYEGTVVTEQTHPIDFLINAGGV
jgi:hypothetical protein